MITSGEGNFLNHLPPGVTEEDIIDLIDGAVAPGRESALIDALRREPRLGLMVKRMRGDRALLGELPPTLPAPVSLLEGIESKLDRAAMASLVEESESAPVSIPIYTPPVVMGRGRLAAFAENRAVRALATAASLAIVGGLGFLGLRELYRAWPRVPQGGGSAVAHNGEEAGERATKIASSTPGSDGVAGDEQPAATTMMAMADLVGPPAPEGLGVADGELTAERAMELAREGRLVIAVRSENLPTTLRLLEQLAAARENDSKWRSFNPGALPMELAALGVPLPDETLNPGVDWPGPTPQAPVYASDRHGQPSVQAVAPLPSVNVAVKHVVNKAVRVVWMPLDAKALEQLLGNLNIDPKGQTGKMRTLPWAIDARPSLDPESVLWWSRSSESWTPRVAVPIVVEVVE